MPNEKEGWRPRRQHRRHIYYKVQVFDETSLTWLDEKNAFDDVATARDVISEHLGGKKVRIMVVDGKRRYPLQE
ncbi:MAG: hypothetical protein ACHQRJ_11305 [Alphaproteobacteria bacterium]